MKKTVLVIAAVVSLFSFAFAQKGKTTTKSTSALQKHVDAMLSVRGEITERPKSESDRLRELDSMMNIRGEVSTTDTTQKK